MAGSIQKEKLPPTTPHHVEVEAGEVPMERVPPFSLLYKYGSQLKRLRSGRHREKGKSNEGSVEIRGSSTSRPQVLSAVSIMEMAEMVQSQNKGDVSNLAEASGLNSRLAHSHGEHLKRLLCLLDAAEKFSNRQHDQAEELLAFVLSNSHRDHAIERIITLYAQVLRERIGGERCKIDLEREVEYMDVDQTLSDLKSASIAYEQKLPHTQLSNFAAIQIILDSVVSAQRIHFIDMRERLGSYWIVMLHALANRKNCRLEQIKITAVCRPQDDLEDAGKFLPSFAESMNLNLVFKTLYSELHELEKDRLELEDGEIVVVYLKNCLYSLAACTINIEPFLIWLKSLNPHVMVISEIEVNATASAFTARFRDALFHSSAVSDCLEVCLEGDSYFINMYENLHFQQTICNGILSEDDDGFIRCRMINFWREYLEKFGIVETDLSESSMHQASTMIKEFPCWSSCTLSMNGKTLLLGWNGIPLRFVSAWKFQQDF